MSEYDDEIQDEGQDDEQHGRGENPNLKQLRAKAKRADELERELQTLKRDRVFDRLGIADSGPGKWFRKGYDGDLDEAAIRAAAVADGLLEDDSEDADLDEDIQVHDEARRATSGRSVESSARVTPATYAGWDRAQRMAFMQQHPDLTEALKRGEEVRVS